MDNERKKKLLETMKKFNKDQKSSLLDFGTSATPTEVIPTGIKSIDSFIGGGTKKGGFTVWYGGMSVGKSTLSLQQIANAQKEGQSCCYIDLEHSFDRDRAESLGVDLEELILAEKCENAEQAEEIIRTLCKEKVVDLFVIDSIQAMSPINEQENKGKERAFVEKEIAELARSLSKFFRVASPHVFNAQASVVLIGQVRIHGIGTFFTRAGLTGGEALKHWASQIVFMRQGQGSDAPVAKYKKYLIDKDKKVRYKTESDRIGFDTVLKLEKTKSSKSQSEGSEIHTPFVFKEGFVNELKEADELPIVIKGTEEEQDIIQKYLDEKGEVESKEKSQKIQEGLEDAKEGNIVSSEEVEIEFEVQEPKKKRSRGRPKKAKE